MPSAANPPAHANTTPLWIGEVGGHEIVDRVKCALKPRHTIVPITRHAVQSTGCCFSSERSVLISSCLWAMPLLPFSTQLPQPASTGRWMSFHYSLWVIYVHWTHLFLLEMLQIFVVVVLFLLGLLLNRHNKVSRISNSLRHLSH